MKKLSLSKIFWILFGIAAGFYGGQMFGMLLGYIIGSLAGVALDGFAYPSTGIIVINTAISIGFGILLALLLGAFDRRLFGGPMPLWAWLGIGAALGALVMFTYGINVVTHPNDYGDYRYVLPSVSEDASEDAMKPPQSMGQIVQASFGTGTGSFLGLYLGTFAGLMISVRETLFRKQTAEEKKQDDEYSRFLKNYSKSK